MSVFAQEDYTFQGTSGDNLYVCEKGKFHVFIKTQDGKQMKKVDSIKKGRCFGELALMYDTPRNATVVAATKSTVWCVDRFTFRAILTNMSMAQLKKYEQLLKGVDLLTPLSTMERSKVAEALEPIQYEHGDVVCRQGDPGACMYIIMHGKVKVTKTYDNTDQTYEINRLVCILLDNENGSVFYNGE